MPFSYLETDPQKLGFNTLNAANPDIMLRLSQSFGYSVAGGIGNFGPNDLGVEIDPDFAAVPEPSTIALLGAGILGFAFLGWRQRDRIAA